MSRIFVRNYWRVVFWIDSVLARANVKERDRWQKQLDDWEKQHGST